MKLKQKFNLLLKHPEIILAIFFGRNRKEIREHVHSMNMLALQKRYFKEIISDIDALNKDWISSNFDKVFNTRRSLNSVCNIEDWNIQEMKDILNEIKVRNIVKLEKLGWEFSLSNPKSGFIHRKDWEWAKGILALDKLGKLNENSTALGIGAGKEVVLYYLANHVRQVYATDLYTGNEDWKSFAPEDFPSNLDRFAPFPFKYQQLTALRMDGRKIAFRENSFDIVFSFSSIEHFGGDNHSGALESITEIQRVLKPGGIAVITTEYILNGRKHQDFFNEQTIYSDLIDHLNTLKLVEPIDTSISPNTLNTIMDVEDAVKWDTDKFTDYYKKSHPYIVLRFNNIILTSIILVFQKE